MPDNWLTFWKGKNAFDELMAVNYSFFLKQVEKYVQPSADSYVLDIGSGPGNLEDAWYNKVKEIHGVDISERYNAMGRQKHSSHPNVFFHDLPESNYVSLTQLGNKKFDIIIVMSVLQYYKNKQEVMQLLMNIKSYASPGAVLLLCDLMVESTFFKEVTQVLLKSLRERKFISTLKLFFNLRFSNYYKVKKQNGFLVLKQLEWLQIMEQLHLNGEFVNEPLTLQKDRRNIIVRF